MNKKNDKRLCWNCDGDVALHLTQCPFCGVDANKPQPFDEKQEGNLKHFASPFQSSSGQVPKPPYAGIFSKDYTVSDDEWNQAMEEEKVAQKKEESQESHLSKKEMIALLLLLPGVVFCLFGLALLFFSHEGVLSLQWNQDMAYFYFIGAIPLIYLGWRALK